MFIYLFMVCIGWVRPSIVCSGSLMQRIMGQLLVRLDHPSILTCGIYRWQSIIIDRLAWFRGFLKIELKQTRLFPDLNAARSTNMWTHQPAVESQSKQLYRFFKWQFCWTQSVNPLELFPRITSANACNKWRQITRSKRGHYCSTADARVFPFLSDKNHIICVTVLNSRGLLAQFTIRKSVNWNLVELR